MHRSLHISETVLEGMAEPVGMAAVGIASLFVASMQFGLQLKTYIDEKRKRQEQEDHHHHAHPCPSTRITYNISYVVQDHVPPPYPYHNVRYHLPPPHPYYNVQYHVPPPYPYHNVQFTPPAVQPPPTPLLYSNHTASRTVPSADPRHLPYDWLGLLDGRMEVISHPQQAPHNTRCVPETLGMRTGASHYNDLNLSYQHWKSLQEESSQGLQGTIAVVDWSRGNIDMFMEIGGTYYRNYRICRCDVAMFVYLLKEREVFSGEIRQGKLQRFNKAMKMVENMSGVRSTNSWMSLGIYGESESMNVLSIGEGCFVETVRGAVFGLVCSLYEAPSDVNLDMEVPPINGHLDIVRVNTHLHPSHIRKRLDPSCSFSVFSLGDRGWAVQDILVG